MATRCTTTLRGYQVNLPEGRLARSGFTATTGKTHGDAVAALTQNDPARGKEHGDAVAAVARTNHGLTH